MKRETYLGMLWGMLVSAVGLQVIDLITTAYLLKIPSQDVNPVMRFFFGSMGVIGIPLLKATSFLIIGSIAWVIHTRWSRMRTARQNTIGILVFLLTLMSLVVATTNLIVAIAVGWMGYTLLP